MTPFSLQPNFTTPHPPVRFTVRFWIAAALAGIAAGVGAGLLMALLRLTQHLAWSYRSGPFLDAARHTTSGHRVLILFLAGLVTAAGLWASRRIWGKQETGISSSIWLRSGALPLLPTLYSGALSIIIVGLGAALGRESAPKEVGAAFASRLCELFRLSSPERRLLTACGAGAGMAAVYNVPVGGALFTLEILLGSLALPNVLPALLVSFVATWVSWLFLPQNPTFQVPEYTVTTGMLIWSILFGSFAGLISVVYVRLVGAAQIKVPAGILRLLLPLLVLTGLGLAAIRFPELLGNGKDVVQNAIDNKMGVFLLTSLLLLRPLATAACLRSGAPGGLFTPTLTFGSLLGSLAGRGWAMIWPGVAPASLGAYAIIGAGALLASTTQAPVSSIVLMLELGTHDNTLIMPLLVATVIATLVSRTLEVRSIYAISVPAPTSGVKAPEQGGC